MFTVRNTTVAPGGIVSFQIAYTMRDKEITVEFTDKSEADAHLAYLRNSFTYLKYVMDEIQENLQSIRKHYMHPYAAPSFENDRNWKDAYYKFQDLKTKLFEYWNNPGEYCRFIKQNAATIQAIIPNHHDLKRAYFKILVQDAIGLPDRILNTMQKYFKLTEKDYETS